MRRDDDTHPVTSNAFSAPIEAYHARGPRSAVLRALPKLVAGHLMVLAALLFLLGGCDLIVTGGPSGEGGQLTVVNNTGQLLALVSWVSQDNTTYWFEPDTVPYSGTNVGGMATDSQQTLDVKAGSSPVSFFFSSGGGEWHTAEAVTVSGGASVQLVLTGGSQVISAALSLGSALSPLPETPVSLAEAAAEAGQP